jgi:hypothetical protein
MHYKEYIVLQKFNRLPGAYAPATKKTYFKLSKTIDKKETEEVWQGLAFTSYTYIQSPTFKYVSISRKPDQILDGGSIIPCIIKNIGFAR